MTTCERLPTPCRRGRPRCAAAWYRDETAARSRYRSPGRNGGIGRGIALGLAETGAAVAIFGRNEEKNSHVLAELKTIGVPSIAVKVDLTDRAALEPALNRVERELGGVSIDYAARVSESPWAVVHFTVRMPEGSRKQAIDVSLENETRIQDMLTEAARTWGDRLLGAVKTGSITQAMAEHYSAAFPQVYKQAFAPLDAIKDIAIIEGLESAPSKRPTRARGDRFRALKSEGVDLPGGGGIEQVAGGDERLKSVEAAQMLRRRGEQFAGSPLNA